MRLILRTRPEPAVKAAFRARSDSGVDNRVVHLRVFHSLGPLRRGVVVAAGLLLAAVPAHAGDDRLDHERARAAVQSGQVLPLATLLQRLQRSHPGRVLEVELEHDDGRWVYELKLLQPGGRLLKLELDAATGAVLKARGRETGAPPEPPPASP
ncbi:MAG: PepSY domain-containing protein [Ideonella sp. WA131b]|jgi:hypothetical protein|nr:PepSY domain-containing protein [Ideonella sp. WA131b]